MDLHKGILKSLGLPELDYHNSFNHFDFTIPERRILVVGPMGSGKTEFSAKVWRDAQVLQHKSKHFSQRTSEGVVDRRHVFFVRSQLDKKRFPGYPPDALAFRSGYEKLGEQIASVSDTWELEGLIEAQKKFGTWIIDEASFYEERIAYLIQRLGESKHLTFILPTLILNFRNEIFNQTARLLLDVSTDIFPLTAYCEHPDCADDACFTYRYYLMGDQEIPAPYFDPLIIVGGDTRHHDGREPNYETRCGRHHFLPAKEYTFLVLKPLAELYRRGKERELIQELTALSLTPVESLLGTEIRKEGEQSLPLIGLPVLAERALVYLCAESHLMSFSEAVKLCRNLDLDEVYFRSRIHDQHGYQNEKERK